MNDPALPKFGRKEYSKQYSVTGMYDYLMLAENPLFIPSYTTALVFSTIGSLLPQFTHDDDFRQGVKNILIDKANRRMRDSGLLLPIDREKLQRFPRF